MRGDAFLDELVVDGWLTDVDVGVAKVELGIDVRSDEGIGVDDVFHVCIGEIVKGMDMLMHQSFVLKIRGNQTLLVLR